MNFWINKCDDEKPNKDFNNAFTFSLNKEGVAGVMYTNLSFTWEQMEIDCISTIYEDLFVIGMSIFSIDKRVSRRKFKDCWTRELKVSIPVIELEKWEKTIELWNKTLSFLTGDIWKVTFRKSLHQYSKREHNRRKKINIRSCDSVCLFSGGLDSFCGAIDILNAGKSPCLFGHNEYPKLRFKQEQLCKMFNKNYPNQTIKFLSFTANSRAPYNSEGLLKGSENTSRGRSLLFLCAALAIASTLGSEAPVYIPENGFIGLNIPLTNSRKGTCSTRTTHPYFIKCFQQILQTVEIKNEIKNPFAYKTKREIVNLVKNTDSFNEGFGLTISCSHPCLPRWNRDGLNEYPMNCGYCYPCLIRGSSLLDVSKSKFDRYSFLGNTKDFINEYSRSEKSNDLYATISSVYRYKNSSDNEIKRLIQCTGKLTEEEVDKFLHVYKETMKDLVELFSVNQDFKDYVGI
ncbi:MAG: Qat anti-phage system QueC-like protein QatC [Bacilli bacterium]